MQTLTEQLEQSDDRADLTPLIDCVFLLLLFFIVASTFSEHELFEVELPKAEHGAPVQTIDDGAVRVAISESGRIAIDGEAVDEEAVYDTLAERHRTEPIQALVIEGDRESPLEQAVLLIDVAHALDIGFSLATEQ